MPVPPMRLAVLTLPGQREPIAWPLERLTEHFALCPGLERDAVGEWHYAPRWWLLCHLWTNDVGESEARPLIAVEQELPPSELIDRPSLAIDTERVRAFAAWLEQQQDWAPRTASVDLAALPVETRDQIDRFHAAPNLWEVPVRATLDAHRQLDRGGDM